MQPLGEADERRTPINFEDPLISDLEDERGTLQYEVRELSAKAADLKGRTPDLLRQWADFTTDRKRMELGKIMKAIILESAPRGRHFDPETVDVAWADV